MAEAQLQLFLDKVRQLNAFVAMSEGDPGLRQELRDCQHHDQVVALARRCGFEIGRRWGEPAERSPAEAMVAEECSPSGQGRPAAAPTTGIAAEAAAAPGACGPATGALSGISEPGPAGSARTADGDHGSLAGLVPQPPDAAEAKRSDVRQALPERLESPGPAVIHPGWRGASLQSLLEGPCPPPGKERSDLLIETPWWQLKRIHSCSYRNPSGFWYEQLEDEWVLLLQGSAVLRFADHPSACQLRTGDSLWIRAGRRHRLTATDPAPGTIWLALFWRPA